MQSAPHFDYHFTLYARSYCHLCDDMLQALREFDITDVFTIDVVDVDASPELVQRYDELVPVLVGQVGGELPVQICHYFLDLDALRVFLDTRYRSAPTLPSG